MSQVTSVRNEWWVKQNDTRGFITSQLLDENLAPVNIGGGATVKFHMKRPTDAAAKVNVAATIIDAALGIVRHSWSGTELSIAGDFEAEWEVTFAGPSVLTFPNDGYDLVHVLKELA